MYILKRIRLFLEIHKESTKKIKRSFAIMKYSIFFLFVGMFEAIASVSYSQTAKLTLDMQDATVSQVISQIETISQFYFTYNTKEIDPNRKVSVHLQEDNIDTAVKQLFAGENVNFVISDKHVVLYKGNAQAEQQGKQQQGITIAGAVTDANGEPLIGASVSVKGTSQGTMVDSNGAYSLSVPDKNATLVFSYLGYVTQEIVVGNKRNINVTLNESTQNIDEVVVVGYGTVRRRDLTGSVSSVNGSTLKDIPVTSASQAIVGRLPGVQVTKTDGSPDAEIRIRVRGGGSITQDNSPLFIVDGFPVDNIDYIVPSDIQSIDVLKDASSTAIYGARGANGVIIVTTKSGSEGEAKIRYNTYYGEKRATKFLGMMDPYEYVFAQYELQQGSSSVVNAFGDPRDFDIWKSFKGTDWQKEILGNKGTSANHNISVSGGTKTARYNLSLTRNDEKEIMMGSGYDVTNFSAKTSYDARKWLKIELNTTYSVTNIKGAGTGAAGKQGETMSRLPHILQFRPVNGLSENIDDQLVDPDDYAILSQFSYNPMEIALDDYRRQTRNILNINGALEFTLLPALKYRFEYGMMNQTKDDKRVFGRRTPNVGDFGRVPMTDVSTEKIKSWRIANTLTYTKRNILPGHSLTVLLGEEMTSRKSDLYSQVIRYFPEFIDPEGALSMAQLGTPDVPSTMNRPPDNLSSLFGRVNYDYKGKYLLSGVFRADGSSKFAPGYQWGYFPSVSAAWNITEESFMNFSKSWLSNLKLRASYGLSGNNRISDDAWKKTFVTGASKYYLDGPLNVAASIIYPGSILSNKTLKWETTVTRNLGLDFGFFKQRLNGTFELYHNYTRDLLIQAAIPSSTGYTTQWQNIGQTSNRGLELTLNGIIIANKDFNLSASFNIGFNRNRVDKLGDVDRMLFISNWATSDGPGADYLVQVGKPVGQMYGYVTNGMYTFADFDYDPISKTYVLKNGVSTNQSIINSRIIMPGVLKLLNMNGDAQVMTANGTVFGADDKRTWPVVDQNDEVVIGNAFPKHTGGFDISSQFKGIDLSLFFNWVYGNNIYNANKLNFTSYQSARNWKNLMSIMNSDQRFTYYDQTTGLAVNDDAQLKAMNQNATIWTPFFSKTVLHSWAVEDGSFLRLNNATIGYSLPKKLLTRFHIEQLRVYCTGYNLWLWTKYSGYDPEVDTQRSTPMTPGVDWCAYPRSRTYNIGLNLTF